MRNNPILAIIILNWNSSPATLDCISKISRWSILHPEVIVVDNGSSDVDISRIQQAGKQIHYIFNHENLGYAGGNNVGITFALDKEYPCIMLLNSDATIGEQCVMKLLECLDHDPDMGVIGPLLEEHGIVYSGGRNIGIYSNTRIRHEPESGNLNLLNVDYVPGTVLLAKGETFEKAGMLDEEYFFSGEVADFCQNVHKAGLKCTVFAGCRATHTPDSDSEIRNSVYNYYNLRNRFLFIRKHFPHTRYLLSSRWIAGGTIQIILALVTGRRERAHAIWLGLRDGVTGRFGDRSDLFVC